MLAGPASPISPYHNVVHIVNLTIVALIPIVLTLITIYFFFVIPNRSRKLVKARLFNPSTIHPELTNNIKVIRVGDDLEG